MAHWWATRAGWGRVLAVAVYATAMGYAETAAVVYIRLLHGGVDPMTRTPTQPPFALTGAEIGREAATIVMLAAIAALAGRGWGGRWGAFLLAFGLWDITYYVFFALLTGWPASPLDWDVLFLIPLPWWGPVLAPAAIAAAMAVSGSVLLLREAAGARLAFDGRYAALGLAGAAVCLYVFMADALAALGGGTEALRTLRPTAFPWPLFLAGYAALAAGFLGTALAGVDGPAAADALSARAHRPTDTGPRAAPAPAEPGSAQRPDRADHGPTEPDPLPALRPRRRAELAPWRAIWSPGQVGSWPPRARRSATTICCATSSRVT